MQPVAADAELDALDAVLREEAHVAGAVPAQQLPRVPLAARRRLERGDFRVPLVGAPRRVNPLNDGGDARFAEAGQVGGELLWCPAVHVGVPGGEADVQPGLRLRGYLVECPVGCVDAGDVDGGPPGFGVRDRVGGQDGVKGAVELEYGVIALPGVRGVRAAALGADPDLGDPLALGGDAQPAGLADHREPGGDPLVQLVQGAAGVGGLLVGDQLQAERVRQAAGQLTEGQGLRERRDLHVHRAPRVQPVLLAVRPELGRRGRDDVQVRVQQHRERGADGTLVDQCARIVGPLEPLHGEPRSDEVEDQVHGPGQFIGPAADRLH